MFHQQSTSPGKVARKRAYDATISQMENASALSTLKIERTAPAASNNENAAGS